jgi:hypothetical protein
VTEPTPANTKGLSRPPQSITLSGFAVTVRRVAGTRLGSAPGTCQPNIEPVTVRPNQEITPKNSVPLKAT